MRTGRGKAGPRARRGLICFFMMLSTDFTNEPAGDARARKQLADHAFCSAPAGCVLFVNERMAACQ